MIDLLTNPWVIILVVLSVVIGNIAALKYTAKMKFPHLDKKPQSEHDSDSTQAKQRDQRDQH